MERGRKQESHKPSENTGRVKLEIYNSQSDLSIDLESVKSLAEGILRFYRIQCELFEITFTTKKEIAILHDQFFEDPSPTDCITLPSDDLNNGKCEVLGEVFVCPKVAIEYSEKNQIDPYEEVSLYTIHGILHLLGYDDIEEEDKKIMCVEEQNSLAFAKKQNILIKPLIEGTS